MFFFDYSPTSLKLMGECDRDAIICKLRLFSIRLHAVMKMAPFRQSPHRSI